MQSLPRPSALNLLMSAVAAAPSGIVIAARRPEGLPLMFANPAFCEMTGYSSDEIVGRNCSFLQGPGTDPSSIERLREALHDGASTSVRLLNYKKSGEAFWNELLISPVVDRDGEVTHFVGVQKDVTREVIYEQALAEQNERLARQSTELERLNTELAAFSAAVSHDLRGPLGVMAALSDAMTSALSKGRKDKVAEMATVIGRTARQLSDLVDALLKAGSADSAPLTPGPVDLSLMAEQVADELRISQPDREVEVLIDPGLEACADGALLRSVVANLLSNAWKFSQRAPRARVRLGALGDNTFFVQDNGEGFDADRAKDLFEPFRRFHHASDFEGTGLGLATVRKIVQRHGGWVRAQSRPGSGATFSFHLGSKAPLHARSAPGQPSVLT